MVRRRRLAAAFFLGAAQGLPASFFLIGLPALMRESGASLDVVALSYLVWAPWALKWLWAPALDAADRGSLIVRALKRLDVPPLCMAACFLALSAFPPTAAGWPVFLIGAICALFGATLQMSLNRWLLLGEPEPGRRALPNAMQVAGMTSGAMVGGSLAAAVAGHASWVVAVAALSALIAATALAAIRAPAIPAPRGPKAPGPLAVRASLTALLRQPGVVPLTFLMFASDFATGVDVLYPALLVDAGFGAAQTTFLLGTVAMAAILPATLVAGRFMQVYDASIVLAALLCAKAAACLGLAALGASGGWWSASAAMGSVIISAMVAVAYLQIYMEVVDPAHAASGLALLTSLRAGFLMAGGLAGGRLATLFSYPTLFSLAAALSLAAATVACARGFGRLAASPSK